MMGGGSRGSMGPLLLVNLVMYVLVLALAGWSLDKYIDRQTHRHLGGNMSTEYLLIFALLAGAVGACSVLAGTMHLRAWRSDSLASAVSAGLVSWALTALSFGLACKQIILGNRGRRLRTLEAFIVILTFTQLLCLMLLCAGAVSSSYGPSCRNSGGGSGGSDYGVMSREQRDTTAASNAPPHA
ncbi:uncharacterized protein LOC109706748 [Ananas comosus]|uniref:Uncharacterized protein LOC109706748 n=1 Tax=Ananas comosus TaxID=4615 RepID=A0A6P5EIU0_ANACO|nr:uncharacterized protein LOC109706748 [Ananas comosus]